MVWPHIGPEPPSKKRGVLGPAAPRLYVVSFWEAFYIENQLFDLDTLRVPNVSPTPILKSNDFRGQSDDIWGARGSHFRPVWGGSGVRAGIKNTYLLGSGRHV